MFEFFRTAPIVNEIQDADLVKKQYKYWRLRIFFGMYVGYALYYFTRKSFTFAMPVLKSELGLSNVELGILASILSIAYGASKFVSGIMGERANPRYFMSIGLILTGIFNVCFGLSSVMWAFALFWGLNGWFQGWGWPGCAKLLTHWYSPSERGRWWGTWNTSHNVGGAIMPLIVPLCAEMFGWRYSLFVPGFVCIASGFYLMYCLRDTPQSMGLPPVETFRNDHVPGQTDRQSNAQLTSKQILFEYVLGNKFIWILAFVSFFIYVVRTAINDWSMLYLTEVKGYTTLAAGFCVFWFELGGCCGGLVAGWSSDLLFKGRRNPVTAIFTVGILLLLVGFRFFTAPAPLLDAAFLFFFGFFIFGPQMLLGMAAAELSHKNAAATSTGFIGSFSYFGAAAAGAPLGMIIKALGWDGFLFALFICTAFALVLLLPLWSVRSNPKMALAKPAEQSDG